MTHVGPNTCLTSLAGFKAQSITVSGLKSVSPGVYQILAASRAMSLACKLEIGKWESLCCLGGEEFCSVLPGTSRAVKRLTQTEVQTLKAAKISLIARDGWLLWASATKLSHRWLRFATWINAPGKLQLPADRLRCFEISVRPSASRYLVSTVLGRLISSL